MRLFIYELIKFKPWGFCIWTCKVEKRGILSNCSTLYKTKSCSGYGPSGWMYSCSMRHGDKPPEYRLLARNARERKTPSTISMSFLDPVSFFHCISLKSSIHFYFFFFPFIYFLTCKKCKRRCWKVVVPLEGKCWDGAEQYSSRPAAEPWREPRWKFRCEESHEHLQVAWRGRTPGGGVNDRRASGIAYSQPIPGTHDSLLPHQFTGCYKIKRSVIQSITIFNTMQISRVARETSERFKLHIEHYCSFTITVFQILHHSDKY